ncbi:pantoate--beta-alanine ligase [Chryseobacterium sp. MFBS3-17]|uniref:pantoate--beta-alanine ligase n=1 Tax=Chryseobacterium sp. MFBS3-17 TaxID=2886689 RepID=UPI001D0F4244|nr:pantoate--beta-alanine ligase [Chryseobacterium sp. MFBS3-17]MCC2590935.1 pantoate--beta-alanine ligase [Chryseobacterium sp. MFBS3-17]
MEILNSRNSLEAYVERNREMGKIIGFAPTMGALHAGHISLYEAASHDNDLIISSIFINPTQFNNAEDLLKYPKTLDQDLQKLKDSGYVSAVYLPSEKDLYPNGTASKSYDFGGLDREMEGASRPGHFDGVGTVVEELLRQVQPDHAYFGEKDFQQLAIIRNLVKQTGIPVKIHAVPTMREPGGLAMSSRNLRLTPTQRKEAEIIHQTLLRANEWFRVLTVTEINERVKEIFENTRLKLEYFRIADEDTLKETDFFYKDRNYRAFIVAHAGSVRLIDNMHLD